MTTPEQTRQGRVAGKKALVTGAAQGLGLAISALLAREGALVAMTDINGAGVQAAADSINARHPGSAFAWQHDVTSEARWIEVLGQANAAMGGLNILVNNAGIGSLGTVEQETLESWHRVFSIDVDSIMLGCKHAMAHMRASGVMGSIVNISSIAGLIAAHNYTSYNAAKAAVWMMSKSIALHGARGNPQIRCNSVHPAFVVTPILDGITAVYGQGVLEKMAKQIPLGHLGEPDDVAYGVLWLASDESKFVTGAEIKIDGGISAQ